LRFPEPRLADVAADGARIGAVRWPRAGSGARAIATIRSKVLKPVDVALMSWRNSPSTEALLQIILDAEHFVRVRSFAFLLTSIFAAASASC